MSLKFRNSSVLALQLKNYDVIILPYLCITSNVFSSRIKKRKTDVLF